MHLQKKKKLRKTTVDDEQPEEPLIDELPAPAAPNHADHGSRSKRGNAAATAKLAAPENEEDEEDLFTHEQPLARKGLAATIALLSVRISLRVTCFVFA